MYIMYIPLSGLTNQNYFTVENPFASGDAEGPPEMALQKMVNDKAQRRWNGHRIPCGGHGWWLWLKFIALSHWELGTVQYCYHQ